MVTIFSSNERLWIKKCIHCGKGFVHKYGLIKGIKRYKCVLCEKQFLGGFRLDSSLIWKDYTAGKKTYKQLSLKSNCTINTIQRRIDAYQLNINPPEVRKVIVLMYTTYWGIRFGVILFKDAITKENLLKYYVKHDSNSLYIQGFNQLKIKVLI